jgi:hypothetical protein
MSAITKQEFSRYINNFDFKNLFIDMGWHNDNINENISLENETYKLRAAAEMSGFKIFICESENGLIPLYKTRRLIEAKVNKLYPRVLIIFIDNKKTEQVWLLVTRVLNQRTKPSEVSWSKSKNCELLYQRTSGLGFEIDDEGKITIVDVTNLVNSQFGQNNERVTKKFYDRFRKEHDTFLEFITGIDNQIHKDWYTSLMLNRLMFCYFIQKRRFLDNDPDYLKNKLKSSKEKHGKDKFYSFYRNFLLTLFHTGLGQPFHSEAVKKEIGIIPYLNGGLFDIHEIEQEYKKIDIADEAFENIFSFFDAYQWTLDTRVNSPGDEINPDVIGYIFEKYINNRAENGAYYTKEDITEYIGKNCIIPNLFDTVEHTWPHPFNKEGDIWRMVKSSGDAYIYDAVKKGVNEKLPQEIEKGIKNVNERTEWNKTALAQYALPAEIWREAVERRNRYAEIMEKIKQGHIHHINDFITYNLNIRQLAQDIIEQSDDPDFIYAWWNALNKITILDPTCGSGAFLFAALNILEPLYESCITRIRGFVEDEDRKNSSNKTMFSNKLINFREILSDIQNPRHPNQKYYIFKTIILNNLYGVDIMNEAVEIAKLRLFLKLVAAVEADFRKPNLGLEPLPDIDFNIRCGNTLVGFATKKEIENAFSGELGFNNDELIPILDRCATLASEFTHFQELQLAEGSDGYSYKKVKGTLQTHITDLREELNKYLALVYGKDIKDKNQYNDWLSNYQPFHWYAEFYQIIAVKGGFDVVIGNPPYISLNKIPYYFNITDYKCSDIYAYIIHRGFKLINKGSRYGFIVMHNLAFSRGFLDARKYLISNSCNAWFSFYARIPAGLFSGDVRVRNCIFLLENNKDTTKYNYYTTRIHRWFSESRDFLFNKLNYSHFVYTDIIPMFNSSVLADFFQTMRGKKLELYENKLSANNLFYKKSAYNWIAISDKPAPCFNSHGKKITQSEVGSFSLSSNEILKIAMLYLSGKLYLSFWFTYGDEFHVTKEDMLSINTPFDFINNNDKKTLLELANNFLKSLDDIVQYKLNAGKNVGTYNTSKLWYITDNSDKIFIKYLCNNQIEIFEAIEDHISSTVLTEKEELEEDEE